MVANATSLSLLYSGDNMQTFKINLKSDDGRPVCAVCLGKNRAALASHKAHGRPMKTCLVFRGLGIPTVKSKNEIASIDWMLENRSACSSGVRQILPVSTPKELGRCQALWSSSEQAAVIWSCHGSWCFVPGQGCPRWSNPQTARYIRKNRTKAVVWAWHWVNVPASM